MNSVTGQDSVIRVMVGVRNGVRERLLDTMGIIGFDVEGYVEEQKLSGQVLNRRTGRLRNSINSKVLESGTSITTSIGTNVSYAKPHEYGFVGTVAVPAYQRMQVMAWGRPITARMVSVRAHPMKLNIPEKSFLRSSLREKGPEEVDRIRKSMSALIAESKS